MPKSNSKKKRNSTSWPRFVTNLPISKILVILVFVAVIKLSLVAVMGVDSWFSGDSEPEQVQAAAEAVRQVVAPVADAQEAKPDGGNATGNSTAGPAKPEGVSEADWRALKQREEAVAQKERALTALEKELDGKLAEMHALERQLSNMLEQANVLKDKRLKQLVEFYSNMKGKNAAEAIEKMDQDLAVKILSGMRGRTAGEILNNVKPEKAAKLSEELTKLQMPLQE